MVHNDEVSPTLTYYLSTSKKTHSTNSTTLYKQDAMYQRKFSLVSARLLEPTFLSTSVADTHPDLYTLHPAKEIFQGVIKTGITLRTKDIFCYPSFEKPPAFSLYYSLHLYLITVIKL